MRKTTNFKDASPAQRFFMGRIFPLIFVLIGVFLIYFGTKQIRLANESRDWPQAEARVLDSVVERIRRSGKNEGTTYRAEIYYEFEVDGVTYSGNRVAYGGRSSSNPSFARLTVNKYPKGKRIQVSYKSDDPNESVIESGIQGQVWVLPLIGLVFSVLGIIMSVLIPRSIRKQIQSSEPNQNAAE